MLYVRYIIPIDHFIILKRVHSIDMKAANVLVFMKFYNEFNINF